jgi:hypothetical protein
MSEKVMIIDDEAAENITGGNNVNNFGSDAFGNKKANAALICEKCKKRYLARIIGNSKTVNVKCRCGGNFKVIKTSIFDEDGGFGDYEFIELN